MFLIAIGNAEFADALGRVLLPSSELPSKQREADVVRSNHDQEPDTLVSSSSTQSRRGNCWCWFRVISYSTENVGGELKRHDVIIRQVLDSRQTSPRVRHGKLSDLSRND